MKLFDNDINILVSIQISEFNNDLLEYTSKSLKSNINHFGPNILIINAKIMIIVCHKIINTIY